MPRIPRVLPASLIVAALLAVVAAGALQVPAVPTPTLPSPNAYDLYVRAAGQYAEADAIQAVFAARGTAESAAERARLVAANAPALATLRRGLALPYLAPPVRALHQREPHLACYRAFARLLTLESLTRGAAGNWAAAADSALDTIALGLQVRRGENVMGLLAADAVTAVGAETLRACLAHLTPEELAAVVQRVTRLRADISPTWAAYEEEKWWGVSVLATVLRRVDWRTAPDMLDDSLSDAERRATLAQLWQVSDQQVLDHYVTYLDTAITELHGPFADRRRIATPTDPASATLVPLVSEVWFHDLQGRVALDLLCLTSALRGYHAAHNAYPETLDALGPIVPADPFGRGEAYRYRREAVTYCLYSIGPDGKDDGGTPIDAGQMSEKRYKVQETSKGDVVAGVNTP